MRNARASCVSSKCTFHFRLGSAKFVPDEGGTRFTMDANEFWAWRVKLMLTLAKAAEFLKCSTRMVKYYESGAKRITAAVEQRCSDIGLRKRLYAKLTEY